MALHVIRNTIIGIINYDKAKTIILRTNDQHVQRHPSTIIVVEGQHGHITLQDIRSYDEKSAFDAFFQHSY